MQSCNFLLKVIPPGATGLNLAVSPLSGMFHDLHSFLALFLSASGRIAELESRHLVHSRLLFQQLSHAGEQYI